jgi:penicillin-binding protein 2
MAVIVENGGHGGSAAGPIARKVMDYYLLGKSPNEPAAKPLKAKAVQPAGHNESAHDE